MGNAACFYRRRLAGEQLAFNFETYQEKKDGHQSIVDPTMQRHRGY
jgi:hypothetical protein